MASSALFLASLLLCVLAIHLAEANRVLMSEELVAKTVGGSTINEPTAVAPLDCGGACDVRCSQSSRPNLCKRACGTCCARCQCVPGGTHGNYGSCPCYATMTTRGGVHKCP